jgi:beta-lactam-binding protein with PASTA domain
MNFTRLKSGVLATVLALAMVLSIVLIGCGPKQAVVPSLSGLSQSDANAAIASAGLVAGNVTEEYSEDASAGTVFRQDPAAGAQVSGGSAVGYVVSKGQAPPPKVSVPDVRGLDEKAATSAIESAGLSMVPYDEYEDDTGKGKSFGQVPEAAESIDQGSIVFVGFSLGAEPTDKEVPDVLGRTESDAVARLKKGGFKTSVKSAHVVGAKKGQVVAQTPRSGEDAGPHSHVIIMVASGSPTAKVPDASGRSQHSAATAISNAGFVPVVYHSVSTDVSRGRVMGQLPAVGKQELHGTEVAIVISGGRASSGTSPTPNVVGMSRASAEGAIQAAGFRHQVVQAHDASVAKGMIVGQVPAAGKQVDPGQDIVIAVSLGPVSKLEATVPSVNGKSKADAESAISKAGLRSLVSQLYSGAVAKGKVMGQLPRAAAKLLKNAQAAIVVSLGKHPPLDIEVPNVTGKSKADAIAALQAAELDPIETLVFTEAAGSGTIYQQLPRAGEKVKKGSRVVIVAAQ